MNEDNGKGYGCFVMLVSGVAIVFSIAALLRHDNWSCEISPAGFVIATLSALITFVVAWQIWTTIASKEELKKAAEAMDRIKELEASLTAQSNMFSQRNLEIRHLIDAHAKLLEADRTKDLASRYYAYGEAIDFLLQSKVDLSYEQFERARYGLSSTFSQLESTRKREEISNFLAREREFDWLYQRLMSMLESKAEEITRLRKQLTHMRDYRRDSLAEIRKKYPEA